MHLAASPLWARVDLLPRAAGVIRRGSLCLSQLHRTLTMQTASRALRSGAVRSVASTSTASARCFASSSGCRAVQAGPGPSSLESDPKLPKSDTQAASDKDTHFGFKYVPESLKESLVGGVFSSVASSYGECSSLRRHRLDPNCRGYTRLTRVSCATRCHERLHERWSASTMEGSLHQEAQSERRHQLPRCGWRDR